jgi:hypothetical protein
MPTETEMLTDQLKLVQALHNIAAESEEAETVRLAAGALMNTEAGRQYLSQNPLVV